MTVGTVYSLAQSTRLQKDILRMDEAVLDLLLLLVHQEEDHRNIMRIHEVSSVFSYIILYQTLYLESVVFEGFWTLVRIWDEKVSMVEVYQPIL